ncbi:SPOR domain-containing protein [Methylobacterium sp. BTF04]|uniref:SPOR domain-containing protein n=1 Tax=Methylobacterium sp. BTF04 TaxID=2708300 RepID=UPI0013D31BCB|nr:SPOR domain-containing protein [Methylobacterium sp. BTF04]NEU11318.1 SPOR domain-containing protein [Methylobacterium sp. BTF04]
MTTNASRAPVDFDAFARDLQQPQPQPHPGQKVDPLAELARIVGQDDPFRALLQARDSRADAAAATARGRIEPTFVDASAAPAPIRSQVSHQAQAPLHPAATPADAFDQYLASVEQGDYHAAEGPPPDAAAFDANDAADRGRLLERPRHRSRLVSVGAGLGVLAVCVTGALTWRGLHGSHGSSGGVPTILADTAPLKIAPQKSDGVEIPDQNKQIYDRTAKDGQIRIVNREEQPLDVAQAARAAGRTTGEGGATPGSASGATPGAAPQQQGTLTESLGEPRRVRTVSVKPDTPVPAPQRETVAEATSPPSVIPTMTLPGAGTDGSATTASLRQRAGRMPPSTPASMAEAPAAEPTIPAPAPTPRVKAPQRVAAVTPEATSALPAPVATRASAAAAPAGSFSVQLGVRTSEGEAQAAFKQMQGKYSQLSGQSALIRQAEVNGKTIYRVRVGPLGKDKATSLCTELQGAGGQCFVAKN